MSKRQLNNICSRLIRNNFIQHLVFWALSYYILLNIFSLSSSIQKIDYIYTSIYLVSLALPVLLNLYLFIPFFLRKGKYIQYILSFLASLFLFAWINQLTFAHFIDVIFPGYFFISFYTYWDLLKFFLVFLGVTTMLQLSKEWFELNAERQRNLELEKERADAELKALTNQVNPHFLFNSLNVIYSLVLNKREESSEAILKLSDILRYVIYDASSPFVSLSKEVEMIRNYMVLQQYRINEESKITFSFEGEPDELKIAPMLLLPLVENGFKHGIKGDVKDTFLDIQLQVKDKGLRFIVTNNKGKDEESIRDAGGIGLQNIQNRLGLIYKEDHSFQIDDKEDLFRVTLDIPDLATPVKRMEKHKE